jgi:hypothetical protein
MTNIYCTSITFPSSPLIPLLFASSTRALMHQKTELSSPAQEIKVKETDGGNEQPALPF